MNVLFDSFPETVEVQGKKYKIVTDFREWIKFSELLRCTEQFNIRILDMILEWYIDARPDDIAAALTALQKFLSAEEMNPEGNEQTAQGWEDDIEGRAESSVEAFSFGQDALCIYSAFMEVYGIDIETIPYMHWWKFLVLFWGLPSSTEIKERIHYRTVDLTSIKNKEERERIKKIRKKIVIRNSQRKMNDYQIGDVFG
ncbi:hypothetical protein GN277_07110 [Lachnospiraceae bacterium WCA-9-b2]|jgi:Bacteriophage Gp15 protein.|uniref:Bacteriophage Gp15 protein n=1 Tax=Sporofaciens musculi TaxID=2681861 RepID=A0A7X3SI89_9FIRM|nr:Gp15 family bacteriophage protein [Sporofaciens musculi]MXP75159.1 hypothetical protein [Sporofaciens musculi]